ncbi:hypothetical protein CHS0354_035257 [Potamilus streckersoni]|uniref:Glutamine amidotransferase domain-containing protein n=1 Tax=Potamilus streckersoni TaxID=2493646 RepID=A0AAE0VNJ5_9BIVA|nr:hypothetical protein CHS0354_035257 [Potamilus streckersoni]
MNATRTLSPEAATVVTEQIDWILKLREYIKLLHSQQIKMFGICFGHQIIADTLGGKTERFSGGWGLGIHTFNQIGQASWRKNHPGSVNIGLSCQDQVIKLPTDASLYLASDFVKNAGYTIGNHVITVQGHPEMPPAYLTYLIEKRLQLKLIAPETEAEVSEFIQNLPPDEAEVAARLREIVISACPGVREYFAYDVPHYAFRRRLCCIWPASQAYSGIDKGVNLGFCEGHLLEKTGHYLTFNNRKQVGVITFGAQTI